MSCNPIELALTSSEYDDEFDDASIFLVRFQNTEITENLVMSNVANQNCATNQLIKKRAKNERLLTRQSKTQERIY